LVLVVLEWYKKSASFGYEDAKERVGFVEEWMRKNESKNSKSIE